SKAVQGSGAGAVPGDASFTVAWTAQVPDGVVYDGATTGTVTVLADGTVADGPQDLPVGTVVPFEETVCPEVPGISWGRPVLDPWSVTVGDGTNTLVTVTNAAVQQVGGFSVAKSVEGEASGLVPDDAQFTVEYSYELDGTTVTGSLTILADGTPVDGPQNLPVGTVVTFTEVDLPTLPGVIWDAPQISPESVTVADDVNAEVVVTNTATLQVGGFQAVKVVEGTGAGRVPAGTEFTVEWTAEVPDEIVYGGETSGTFALLTDGTVAVGPLDLPVGTVVTFAEPEIPEFDGVVWGAPAFDPETVTVADGQVVTVTVTNTATELFGTFSVEKQVAGEAAGL